MTASAATSLRSWSRRRISSVRSRTTPTTQSIFPSASRIGVADDVVFRGDVVKPAFAAFHLEDQVSPKKCGHYEGKHGTVKACKDAEGVVSDLRLKLDAATYALGEKP